MKFSDYILTQNENVLVKREISHFKEIHRTPQMLIELISKMDPI